MWMIQDPIVGVMSHGASMSEGFRVAHSSGSCPENLGFWYAPPIPETTLFCDRALLIPDCPRWQPRSTGKQHRL